MLFVCPQTLHVYLWKEGSGFSELMSYHWVTCSLQESRVQLGPAEPFLSCPAECLCQDPDKRTLVVQRIC